MIYKNSSTENEKINMITMIKSYFFVIYDEKMDFSAYPKSKVSIGIQGNEIPDGNQRVHNNDVL